jgi:hypothetical protein
MVARPQASQEHRTQKTPRLGRQIPSVGSERALGRLVFPQTAGLVYAGSADSSRQVKVHLCRRRCGWWMGPNECHEIAILINIIGLTAFDQREQLGAGLATGDGIAE